MDPDGRVGTRMQQGGDRQAGTGVLALCVAQHAALVVAGDDKMDFARTQQPRQGQTDPRKWRFRWQR